MDVDAINQTVESITGLQQQRQELLEQANKIDDAIISGYVRIKKSLADANLLERADSAFQQQVDGLLGRAANQPQQGSRRGRKPGGNSVAEKALDILRQNKGQMPSGELAMILGKRFNVANPHSIIQSLKNRKSAPKIILDKGKVTIVER
jgi:hypothetical protein